MSITFGFFNSKNGDRKYDAKQMSSLFDGIIRDGVFSSIGDKLIVKATNTNTVQIGTGKAWFDHTWTLVDAIETRTIERGEAIYNRIDAVVLEVNATTRENTIKVVKGTPASQPKRPAMVKTTEVHQHALAYVSVKANATTFDAQDVTPMIGTPETPVVTGLLQQMTIPELGDHWQAQLDEFVAREEKEFMDWMNQQKGNYDAWKTEQETDFAQWSTAEKQKYAQWIETQQNDFLQWRQTQEGAFDTWFDTIKGKLDGDTAGKLQGQIDALTIVVNDNLAAAKAYTDSQIKGAVEEAY